MFRFTRSTTNYNKKIHIKHVLLIQNQDNICVNWQEKNWWKMTRYDQRNAWQVSWKCQLWTELIPIVFFCWQRKFNFVCDMPQCSKIGKKCNFKSAKNIICIFKNGKKSIFTPEKSLWLPKMQFSDFFLVQKLIFCHFWKCK